MLAVMPKEVSNTYVARLRVICGPKNKLQVGATAFGHRRIAGALPGAKRQAKRSSDQGLTAERYRRVGKHR